MTGGQERLIPDSDNGITGWRDAGELAKVFGSVAGSCVR